MPNPWDPNSSGESAIDEGHDVSKETGGLSSVLLGALCGIPIGSVFGAATCYMLGMWEELWTGVVAGAIAGFVVGGLTILLDQIWRDTSRRIVATKVGLVMGLIPTAIALTRIGAGRHRWLVIGAVFIGPAIGLLIGAFFDRAIDEWRNRGKAASVLFSALGVAICCILVFWINASAYGASEEEIEFAVRHVVTAEWINNPRMKDATIENIVVVRHERRAYKGSFDAVNREGITHYAFDARSLGEDIDIEWRPVVE